MGATLSQYFPTPEECDVWAEQQSRLAARWGLHKTADLGNLSVLRVPVIGPSGQPEEITIPVEPGKAVEPHLHYHLHQSRRFSGYREDPLRHRQRAFVRSLRFD